MGAADTIIITGGSSVRSPGSVNHIAHNAALPGNNYDYYGMPRL